MSSKLHLLRTMNSVDGFVRISRFQMDGKPENTSLGFGKPGTKLIERIDSRPQPKAIIPLSQIKIRKIRNNTTRRANSQDCSLTDTSVEPASGVESFVSPLKHLDDSINDSPENQQASLIKGSENRRPRLSIPPPRYAKPVLTKINTTLTIPPSPLNYHRSTVMLSQSHEPDMEKESMASCIALKPNRQTSATQRVTQRIVTQVRKFSNSTKRKIGITSSELASIEPQITDGIPSPLSPSYEAPLRRIVSPTTLFDNLSTYITRYESNFA